MTFKLKEKPAEWQKFTAAVVMAAGAGAFLLHRRTLVRLETLVAVGLALALVLLVCIVRPRWFRGFYRLGMTASFYVGRVMGALALVLFFLLVLTPLSLLLRLLGKDLLATRRRSTNSYWHP